MYPARGGTYNPRDNPSVTAEAFAIPQCVQFQAGQGEEVERKEKLNTKRAQREAVIGVEERLKIAAPGPRWCYRPWSHTQLPASRAFATAGLVKPR